MGAATVALILTSPFYSQPLAFLHENAFARFCMFWCLAVFSVLSFANRPTRPSTVAILATAISAVVVIAFYLGCAHLIDGMDISEFYLSCLSGAILGALAGTWLIYVLEVYVSK